MELLTTTNIIIGALILFVIFLWLTYNTLITLRERIKEALSHIDVQLKRRAELIPNLVETVRGYTKHEKDLLENVTKARTSLMSAKSNDEKAEANNQITQALKSIFAVAENYPTLKANENFLKLQEELSDTENKIAYSRQFYNSNVLDYNTKIQTFPSSIIAGMFKFNPSEFFGATEEERKSVKVTF